MTKRSPIFVNANEERNEKFGTVNVVQRPHVEGDSKHQKIPPTGNNNIQLVVNHMLLWIPIAPTLSFAVMKTLTKKAHHRNRIVANYPVMITTKKCKSL